MEQGDGLHPGPPEGAHRATRDGPGKMERAPASCKAEKTEVVLPLLRGEGLELLSRELGVTATKLSSWRE